MYIVIKYHKGRAKHYDDSKQPTVYVYRTRTESSGVPLNNQWVSSALILPLHNLAAAMAKMKLAEGKRLYLDTTVTRVLIIFDYFRRSFFVHPNCKVMTTTV